MANESEWEDIPSGDDEWVDEAPAAPPAPPAPKAKAPPMSAYEAWLEKHGNAATSGRGATLGAQLQEDLGNLQELVSPRPGRSNLSPGTLARAVGASYGPAGTALASQLFPGDRQALSENKERLASAGQQHPWASAAGNLTGTVLNPENLLGYGGASKLLGVGKAAPATGILARVLDRLKERGRRGLAGALVAAPSAALSTYNETGDLGQAARAILPAAATGFAGAAAPVATGAGLATAGAMSDNEEDRANLFTSGLALMGGGGAQALGNVARNVPANRLKAENSGARALGLNKVSQQKKAGDMLGVRDIVRRMLNDKRIGWFDDAQALNEKIEPAGERIGERIADTQDSWTRRAQVVPFDRPEPRQLSLPVSERPAAPKPITGPELPLEQGDLSLTPGAKAPPVPDASRPGQAMRFDVPVQETMDLIPGRPQPFVPGSGQSSPGVVRMGRGVPGNEISLSAAEAAPPAGPPGTFFRSLQEALPGMAPTRPSMSFPAKTPPVQSVIPPAPNTPTGTLMAGVQDVLPGLSTPKPRMNFPAPVPAPQMTPKPPAPWNPQQTAFLGPEVRNPITEQMTPEAVASLLEKDLGKTIRTSSDKPLEPAIRAIVENMRSMGKDPMTFRQLNQEKAKFGEAFDISEPSKPTPPKALRQAAQRSLRNLQESLGEQLAKFAGDDGSLEQWRGDKRAYGDYEKAAEASLAEARRQQSRGSESFKTEAKSRLVDRVPAFASRLSDFAANVGASGPAQAAATTAPVANAAVAANAASDPRVREFLAAAKTAEEYAARLQFLAQQGLAPGAK